MSLSHGIRKSRLRLCRLLPMFSLIVFNTSVPAVLPSGQCIKRCTAKDNADVTDQYQQTVALCESIINCLYLMTAGWSVVAD